MEYVDTILSFEQLYNMFIYDEQASIFLETVKKLHLEKAYMAWLDEHFKDTVPAKCTIEYAIVHEWDDFRMHIPYLKLENFTPLMHELVEEMDYLEKTDDLTFPLVEKWENLPSGWARFAKEVYDYVLPIKVKINVSDTKAYVITVMKDFREVFEERKVQENA